MHMQILQKQPHTPKNKVHSILVNTDSFQFCLMGGGKRRKETLHWCQILHFFFAVGNLQICIYVYCKSSIKHKHWSVIQFSQSHFKGLIKNLQVIKDLKGTSLLFYHNKAVTNIMKRQEKDSLNELEINTQNETYYKCVHACVRAWMLKMLGQ